MALDVCRERLQLGEFLDRLDGSAALVPLLTTGIVVSRAMVVPPHMVRIVPQLSTHIVPPELVHIAIVIIVLVHLLVQEVAHVVIELIVAIVIGVAIGIVVAITPDCVARHCSTTVSYTHLTLPTKA